MKIDAVERMVLVMLDNAKNNCARLTDLQLVISVMNKRHKLMLENVPAHVNGVLDRMSDGLIERSPYGYKLGPGGKSEAQRLQSKQGPLYRKLAQDAAAINRQFLPLAA